MPIMQRCVDLGSSMLLLVIALLCVMGTRAQTDHFGGDEVVLVWEVFTNPVGPGNGVFLSPREDVLVVVSSDSVVRGFNPVTGAAMWTFPPTAGSTATAGAFFSPFAPTPYFVYCVSNGASSSVIGINQVTGAQLFTTSTIQGRCVGTPVTTADGQYVLVTHNVGDALGVEAPFGAIGHFWGPTAGYYDGGESNNNDIFIWCLDSSPTTNGTIGQIFAFQMPVVDGSGYNVTTVGGERDFVSPLPPVIVNNGFSMYWAVSHSEQRAWVGEQDLGRRDFTTNGVNTVGFFRGEPATSAAAAPPTLSDDSAMSFVIGPTASNQLFRMSFDYSEDTSAPTVFTSAPITSKVIISRDLARAYYGTPAPEGNIHCIDSTSLDIFWNISMPGGVSGEMALSLNGDTLYVADALGGVRAFTVADAPEITMAPANQTQTPAPVIGTFSPAPGGPNSTAPPVVGTFSPKPGSTFSPKPVGFFSPSSRPLAPTVSPLSPVVTRPPRRPTSPAPSIASSAAASIAPRPTDAPTRLDATDSERSNATLTLAPVNAPVFIADTAPTSATNSFETMIDTPVQIPSRLRANENMTIVEWPLGGAVRVGSDGTITYIPSPGFVGVDSFNVQICTQTSSPSCRFERLYVSVRAATMGEVPAREESASKPLYLLSLLALIPIGVIVALIWWKRLQQESTTKATALPISASNVHTSMGDTTHATAAVSDLRTTPHHATTVVAVAVHDSEPVVASTKVVNAAVAAEALPDFKDQCRLEPAGIRLYPHQASSSQPVNVFRVDSDDESA